jgi:hypothetical protein
MVETEMVEAEAEVRQRDSQSQTQVGSQSQTETATETAIEPDMGRQSLTHRHQVARLLRWS